MEEIKVADEVMAIKSRLVAVYNDLDDTDKDQNPENKNKRELAKDMETKLFSAFKNNMGRDLTYPEEKNFENHEIYKFLCEEKKYCEKIAKLYAKNTDKSLKKARALVNEQIDRFDIKAAEVNNLDVEFNQMGTDASDYMDLHRYYEKVKENGADGKFTENEWREIMNQGRILNLSVEICSVSNDNEIKAVCAYQPESGSTFKVRIK
jgi:hypothetical protein